MGFVNALPTALGFSVRNRLIIGVPEGYPWGMPNGEDIEACPHSAIEGLLYGFQVKQVEGQDKSRFRIFLQDLETKEIDMISSGFETNKKINWFAKSFCLSLCSPDFDHRLPIILYPHKGDSSKAKDPMRAKKIVFCRVYQKGQLIKTDQQTDIDCLKSLEALAPNFPNVPLYFSDSSEEDNNEVDRAIHYQDLFDEEKNPENTVSFQDLMTRNNAALKRLGWSQEKGREYLVTTYGKKSRQLLSDEQLIEFTDYLESLVSPQSDFEDF